ncbi:von Willebrand factor D and EGF domain-containing protein-like [Polistes fuscatus]|uniref:von Willebrand factor D and EGF domain-containing protein-like n=1 Tax=Polistes fuscatus TaxID=30207 RepID=UPI001CA94BBA|nr:von Willebrand factor D and EGF domain-containing protein-like [Polistes fuscatus]
MQKRRINYKIKDYPTYHIEEECCEGFKEVDNKCVPDCSPRCENGSCVAPNICECFPGYAITMEKRHVCKPICTNGCLNGECVQPEVCICSPHYFLDPDGYTCHPTCYDKCDLDNGYCSGPNTCSCHIGYKKSNKSNICEPICERECINGKCVEPDLCSCNDDYELDINDSFNCIPKCEQTCLFGRCTAPNVCTCNEGYEAINGTHCKPICTKPCKIGICVAPDICIDHKGYSLIEENDTSNNINVIENLPLVNCNTTENNKRNAQGGYICQLICDINCLHGSCKAPNVCTCNEGYRKNEKGRCVLKDICTNIQCQLHGLDDILNKERYKQSKKIDGKLIATSEQAILVSNV